MTVYTVKKLTSAIAILLLALSDQVCAEWDFIRKGRADFVVSSIQYALSHDAEVTGACPDGMTTGYDDLAEVIIGHSELNRMTGESEQEQNRRIQAFRRNNPNVKNLCQNPELGQPDSRFKTIQKNNIPAFGIDLDGVHSQRKNTSLLNTCPHDDFVGMAGETGIDNQFFRFVGCDRHYQSTGSSNSFDIEMLSGSWGILISIDNLDDPVNDDHVVVNFYANGDPIDLSADRKPLSYATYSAENNTRYQATTQGKMEDGVLTTQPVDVRMHWVVNSMLLDRPLRDSVLQMSLSEEGILKGYLAGYTPIEDLYDYSYGFRNATKSDGEIASLGLRVGSSIGKARVQGYTCEGVYQALYANADAYPDPKTGQCTAISTQYQIKAIPAFIVTGNHPKQAVSQHSK